MQVKSSVLMGLFSLSAFAGDVVVDWKAGETPETVADGAVALVYEGGAVKTMTADNAKDVRVVFTGDALSFAAGATIAPNGGPLVFSGAVSAAGDIAFVVAPRDLQYGNWNKGVSEADKQAAITAAAEGTCVFAGATLADLDLVNGSFCGSSVSDVNQGLVMTPCCVTRSEDGARLSTQMQVVDGSWLKCVYLELWQNGADVHARVTKACYGSTSSTAIGNHKFALGDDFDVYPGASMSLATPNSWGSYGIKGLTARIRISEDDVTIAQPFAAAGTVGVTNVGVTVEGAGALAATGGNAVAPLALSDASVTFTNVVSRLVTLDNPIAARNATVKFMGTVAEEGATESFAVEQEVKNASVLVAPGKYLADLAGVETCYLLQNSPFADLSGGAPFYFQNDGAKATVQLQVIAGGWNKCAFVTFTQGDAGVYAMVTKAYWKSDSSAPLGTDMTNCGASTRDFSYYPSTMTLAFRDSGKLVVAANAVNDMRATTLVLGLNATFNANVLGAVPHDAQNYNSSWNDALDVYAGGTLNLYAAGDNSKGACNGTTLRVHAGGVVNQLKSGAFSQYGEVWIDGGTLALSTKSLGGGSSTDSGTYLDRLRLTAGARVTGCQPRIGMASPNTWKITGSGEAPVHASGAILANDVTASAAFGRDEWEFRVDDVTGDAAPDFVFGGPVCDYAGGFLSGISYYGVNRVKTGAGTMRIDETCVSTALTGLWQVVEGTLQVGASDVFSAVRGTSLKLRGGTLALEEGTVNSFYRFESLTADSGIAVAAGATLELPGAPEAWTDGALLNVTLADDTARLRFGTSKDALTRLQCANIRVNGEWKARLDADGYVHAQKFGTTILIR